MCTFVCTCMTQTQDFQLVADRGFQGLHGTPFLMAGLAVAVLPKCQI